MDNLDTQVLAAAQRWAAAGHRFALVTVARTWGSAPRPPGAWMALRDDGLVQGSVSGGCIEDDLIYRMRAGEFSGSGMQLVRYGVTQDEAHRFGLPCGGTLELVIEEAPDLGALAEMAERIAAGQLVQRRLLLSQGRVEIDGGRAGNALLWTVKRCSPSTARPGACCWSGPGRFPAFWRRWRRPSATRSSSAIRARNTPGSGMYRGRRCWQACRTTWCSNCASTRIAPWLR